MTTNNTTGPDTTFQTQPMQRAVETVRRILTTTLESGPDVECALTITEALDVLVDVEPPYAPPGFEDEPIEPEAGLPAALLALDAAADAATSVRELTRYTAVAMLLQRLVHLEVGQ